MNVLVADDQLAMRDLLKTILRTLRVSNIDIAGDGVQAVDRFRQKRHDMVFLDIEMPELNGFSALRQIRIIEPDAFIVMVSAHSSVDNVKKSLELGAKGFVVKPYTSIKIADMLKKYREAGA
ncbi:MAG: response regulator [Gammaproteobacteria bacterium]|nr:response regulator [Gammaproteobacteria bacterium]